MIEDLLEIKSFSSKHLQAARQSNLIVSSWKLKWSHKYYTHIQGQLNIADKLYCNYLLGYQKATRWKGYIPMVIGESCIGTNRIFVWHLMPEIMTRKNAGDNTSWQWQGELVLSMQLSKQWKNDSIWQPFIYLTLVLIFISGLII